MENYNREKILNLVRMYGPISRTSLSEMMGISMTAITKFINELIADHIIHEIGIQESTSGRKPILLKINSGYGYIIAVDFGQSFLRLAALDMNNQILSKREIPSLTLQSPNIGTQYIMDEIKDLIKSINLESKPLAIGIAVSGMMKSSVGSCITIPNLREWKNIDLLTPFSKEFQIPVYIDDSARMMALCESIIPGKGRHKNLIFINIGTGIGTGIIVFGRLLRGGTGMAGELGHIIVNENGSMCGCGNRGCLEQYAAVPSIVRSAKNAITNGVRSSILDYAANKDINNVDSYCISKAAKDIDKLACSILMDTGYYLGIGMSQLINLFNPELIVVGGGGAEISAIILEEAVKTCQIRAITEAAKFVKIQESRCKENCALTGVAIFAQDNLFKLKNIQESTVF